MSRFFSPMIVGLLFAVVALPAAPAAALESVEEVLCICSDGALNTGDFVSCMSHLTRRLVADGVIDNAERQELVSGASSMDLDAIQVDCVDSGDCELEGWGVSMHLTRAFIPVSLPRLGRVTAAIGYLRLWNYTPDDVFHTRRTSSTGEGCLFRVRVLNEQGLIVRQETMIGCNAAMGGLDLPGDPLGTLLEEEILIPTLFKESETGDLDDEPLPEGIYRVEVRWIVEGPNRDSSITLDGGVPLATITMRLE
jgi:hypothetical protein